MAYFDHEAAEFNKKCKENYEALKKFISSTNEEQKINEWYFASQHIHEMEITIERQQKQIDEYKKFFVLLSELLPRQFSIHDKFG